MNLTIKQIQKYKNKPIKNLIKTAEKYFNKFIRLRDTDENGFGMCISSGLKLRYGSKNCQAGHYYAAGKVKSLKFNEDNVNLQSLSDNYFGSGNLAPYAANLVLKIGIERFEKLQLIAKIEKQNGYKFDRLSLINTIETYKGKCNHYSKNKMFEVK